MTMTEIEEKNVNENPIGFKYVEGPVIVYKGFDKDFCCHGKQYEVGKSYHTDGDVKSLCEAFYGFIHATETIVTYKPDDTVRFAVVELSGTVGKRDDNFHMATDMTIIREIDLPGLMKRVSCALESRKIELGRRHKYFFEPDYVIRDHNMIPLTLKDKKIYVNGRNSMLSSMGGGCEVLFDEGSVVSGMGVSQKIISIAIEAKIMSSGDVSHIDSYGERTQICNMGDLSQMFVAGNDTCLLNNGHSCSVISTGKDINISDCGFDTFIASSGENASITASGDNAHILSTGDNAHIAVTGDDAFVNCFGKNTVISIIGKGCVVTAKDWKDVTFVGVHADLVQLSAKGYTSISSFNPNTSDSVKWRFMNDGKIEESKK